MPQEHNQAEKSVITLSASSSPAQTMISCHWWRSGSLTDGRYGSPGPEGSCLDVDVWAAGGGGGMDIVC